MTEDEAHAWVAERFDAPAIVRLEQLVALVSEEAARQNLISASTLPQIWTRHIVDSAQLLSLAESQEGDWLDIGSGAGFPGLIVAVSGRSVTLVEPRRKRADFLVAAAAALGFGRHCRVVASKVEAVTGQFAVISARAVAALPALFDMAIHCAEIDSLWIAPKGRSAMEEVARARQTWHGTFHVEHSITDPESRIVLANGVRRG